MKFKLFIGIDLAKSSFTACFRSFDDEILLSRQFSNNAKGIKELLCCIKEYECEESAVLICCEHTGCYLEQLAYTMRDFKGTFWVVHPTLLKFYSIEIGRGKTDKADAEKISNYALMHRKYAKAYHQLDFVSKQIRELFIFRKQLIKQRVKLENQRHANAFKVILPDLNAIFQNQLIETYKRIEKEIEKEIKKLITSDKHINRMYKILTSIPGIGPVIAQHILYVTDCFKKISDWKAFCCYIGTAPYPFESGTVKRKPQVSKKAYRKLKADFFQGAMSITRENQLFHNYYIARQGLKHHLAIINAIINQIIKLAFHLVKTDQLFNEEKFLSQKKSFHNLEMSW